MLNECRSQLSSHGRCAYSPRSGGGRRLVLGEGISWDIGRSVFWAVMWVLSADVQGVHGSQRDLVGPWICEQMLQDPGECCTVHVGGVMLHVDPTQ